MSIYIKSFTDIKGIRLKNSNSSEENEGILEVKCNT